MRLTFAAPMGEIMMKRTWIAILLCMFLSFPAYSQATADTPENSPIETIRNAVDRVLSLLKDPAYDDPSKKDDQLDKMWQEVQKVFDFKTMSRGTLRRHQWESFSKEQKEQFTSLFSKLLGNTYLERIQEEYQNEKMVYLEQEMLSDSKALVKTEIVREGLRIPIDYRMILADGKWMVYNVYVENTSLVSNYRDQFSRILVSDSPAELIKMLKDKISGSEKS